MKQKENESLIKHPGTWIIVAPLVFGAIQSAILVYNADPMQGIHPWMVWLFMVCFTLSGIILARSPRAKAAWKALLGFPLIGMLLLFVGSIELFAKTGSHYDPSKPFTAMFNDLMPTLAVLSISVGPVALMIYFLVKAWPDRHRLIKAN
ncbi:hypothetical protein [Halomonas sp. LBP4]|uniref:hypothetical protein n=1 Tax=Halomonas sp. LBP4 TaxID=2044917 RepID=UPI000D771CE2|nr:hypothetical protein [Halomonas sp. LBP4]PXX94691.1 hypothetical protein CR157_21545 [Halomonas sp. LBP4]